MSISVWYMGMSVHMSAGTYVLCMCVRPNVCASGSIQMFLCMSDLHPFLQAGVYSC